MTESEAISAIQNDLKWHSKELKPAYKEALRMAIKALEKQIAKKPIKVDSGVYDYPYDYECPSCRKNVDETDHHCECGQKLDWE